MNVIKQTSVLTKKKIQLSVQEIANSEETNKIYKKFQGRISNNDRKFNNTPTFDVKSEKSTGGGYNNEKGKNIRDRRAKID